MENLGQGDIQPSGAIMSLQEAYARLADYKRREAAGEAVGTTALSPMSDAEGHMGCDANGDWVSMADPIAVRSRVFAARDDMLAGPAVIKSWIDDPANQK